MAGCNVYENDEYKATVFSIEYQAAVAIDASFSYCIVALDFDGNFACRTASLLVEKIVNIADDTESPNTPENLTATWLVDDDQATIDLSWNDSTDIVDIAGYDVYENNQYLNCSG